MSNTRKQTAENGVTFTVESVNPWDLRPGDRVFYHWAASGYAVILAVGTAPDRVSIWDGKPVRVTPVLSCWDGYEPSVWETSNGTFGRIVSEV